MPKTQDDVDDIKTLYSNSGSVILVKSIQLLNSHARARFDACAVGSSWVGLTRWPDGHKWVDGSDFGGVGNAPTVGDAGCYRFDGNSLKSFHYAQCAHRRGVICQYVCGNKNEGKLEI